MGQHPCGVIVVSRQPEVAAELHFVFIGQVTVLQVKVRLILNLVLRIRHAVMIAFRLQGFYRDELFLHPKEASAYADPLRLLRSLVIVDIFDAAESGRGPKALVGGADIRLRRLGGLGHHFDSPR